MNGFSIVLDPGHGGDDDGAVAGGFIESRLNLLVAVAVRDSLCGTGYSVGLTRETNSVNPSWDERDEIARNHGAGLVVSIHFNANPSPTIGGFEAYHWPGNTDARLICVQASEMVPTPLRPGRVFNTDTDGDPRSWKQRPRTVLRAYDAPAVLFECAYLTNHLNVAYLQSDRAIQEIATTIRSAIVRGSSIFRR